MRTPVAAPSTGNSGKIIRARDEPSGRVPTVPDVVPPLIAEARSLLSQHDPLGASTGFMDDARGDWPALVARARATSSMAVELAALGEEELDGLAAFLASRPALPFRHLSIHGPVKGLRLPEDELVARLGALRGRISGIVMHPDTMRAPERYAALGSLLVVENMDPRKATGRTADELAPFFDVLPRAGFCLDVAHAGAVDPSMEVAHELLDRFGARLRHLHLSSLDPDAGGHVPLTASDEERFGPVLARCRDVPWILEAPLA